MWPQCMCSVQFVRSCENIHLSLDIPKTYGTCTCIYIILESQKMLENIPDNPMEHDICWWSHCRPYKIHCRPYKILCRTYNIQCRPYKIHCRTYKIHCRTYKIHCSLYKITFVKQHRNHFNHMHSLIAKWLPKNISSPTTRFKYLFSFLYRNKKDKKTIWYIDKQENRHCVCYHECTHQRYSLHNSKNSVWQWIQQN